MAVSTALRDGGGGGGGSLPPLLCQGDAKEDREQSRQSMSRRGIVVPGVFRWAGLMVPDPSTPWDPPIPFIEVVTGRVVEYMATEDGTAAGGGGQRPLDA